MYEFLHIYILLLDCSAAHTAARYWVWPISHGLNTSGSIPASATAASSRSRGSRSASRASLNVPEDVNWSQHRIASSDQQSAGYTGTPQSIPYTMFTVRVGWRRLTNTREMDQIKE